MPSEDSTPDVLTSLPRTRPQRRSARRADAAAPGAAAAPAKAKPKSKAKATTAAKAPGAKSAPRTKAAPKAPAARKGPKAPPRRIPPAGFAPPADEESGRTPSGTEIVGTAIQAAGELAQMGLAVGGQALRGALGRLGRN